MLKLQYLAHLGLIKKTTINILLFITIYSLFNINTTALCMLDGSNLTEVSGSQSNIIETLQTQIRDLSHENRTQREEIIILRSIVRENIVEIVRLQEENANLRNQITAIEFATEEHNTRCSCTIL